MVVVVVGVRFLAGQVPGKTEPPKERAAEMDEKTLVSQLSLRWILDTYTVRWVTVVGVGRIQGYPVSGWKCETDRSGAGFKQAGL